MRLVAAPAAVRSDREPRRPLGTLRGGRGGLLDVVRVPGRAGARQAGTDGRNACRSSHPHEGSCQPMSHSWHRRFASSLQGAGTSERAPTHLHRFHAREEPPPCSEAAAAACRGLGVGEARTTATVLRAPRDKAREKPRETPRSSASRRMRCARRSPDGRTSSRRCAPSPASRARGLLPALSYKRSLFSDFHRPCGRPCTAGPERS